MVYIANSRAGVRKEGFSRQGEDRYRTVFDSISDGVFIYDPVIGAILDVNRRACEMWGFSRVEMLALEISDLSFDEPPYDRKIILDWIRKASYKPQVFEWRCRNYAGRAFWCEFNLRSNTVGKKRVVVLSVRDISSRKEAELRRRRAVANLDALFRAINDSICLMDKNGVVLHANHAMARQLSLSQKQIIGKQCYELMHGTSCFVPNCPLQRMLKSRQRESLEIRKGDQWFNITTDPVFDEKGELVGAVHISRDISERKRLAMEREKLLEKIQAANSEIKALHGIIPICANCKNIRNEKGDWLQIESYIETRSDVHFTHGICPDCAKKLYPQYHKEKGTAPRKSTGHET